MSRAGVPVQLLYMLWCDTLEHLFGLSSSRDVAPTSTRRSVFADGLLNCPAAVKAVDTNRSTRRVSMCRGIYSVLSMVLGARGQAAAAARCGN